MDLTYGKVINSTKTPVSILFVITLRASAAIAAISREPVEWD
jgi:hypothetical protein